MREIRAEASVMFDAESHAAIQADDGFAQARAAGILAARWTERLVVAAKPCQTNDISLTQERVGDRLIIRAVVTTASHQGGESEALTAVSVAALNLMAMAGRGVLENLRLTQDSAQPAASIMRHAETLPIATRLAQARAKAQAMKPSTLMGEVVAVRQDAPTARREAFRNFMSANGLRASHWAKEAGVAPNLIYAFLTGRSGQISPDDAAKLARVAKVRAEDMFKP